MKQRLLRCVETSPQQAAPELFSVSSVISCKNTVFNHPPDCVMRPSFGVSLESFLTWYQQAISALHRAKRGGVQVVHEVLRFIMKLLVDELGVITLAARR